MREYWFFAPKQATEKSRACKHQATNRESVVRRRGQAHPRRRIRQGGKIETARRYISDGQKTALSGLNFGKAYTEVGLKFPSPNPTSPTT